MCADGEAWYPEVVIIIHTVRSNCLPLHLVSSVPQHLNFSPQLCMSVCVCVWAMCVYVVESVAGIPTRRECRHKHWKGSTPSSSSSAWKMKLSPLPRLDFGICNRLFDDSHKQKHGTWIGGIQYSWQHMWSPPSALTCKYCACLDHFVLHKS